MKVRRLAIAVTVVLPLVLLTACGAPRTTAKAIPTTTIIPPTPTTATSSPPSQEVVNDLTWVSDTHGWALVSQSGCQRSCTSEVLTTTNGGASWTEVGSLPSSETCVTGCDENEPQAFNIRFGNDSDGYAFDPNLFVTTDGGRSWVPEQGPQVVALEIAGSSVIRISSTHGGCPGPCDAVVEEAPIGSSSWRELYPIPIDAGRVQLVRQGPDNVYAAGFQNPAGGAVDEQTTLFISHDGGVSWTERADPCGYSGAAENDTEAMAAAPDDVLAVLCSPRFGGADFVDVSSDGGKTFDSTASLPGDVGFLLVAVTNPDDVFVSTGPNGGGQGVLEASHDGGRNWNQVASDTGQAGGYSSPNAGFLGFESSSVGRWIGSPSDIWTTTDDGITWSYRPI